MPEPTFSVIIPTVGRPSLAETLASIEGQHSLPLDGHTPFDEVLVLPDGEQPTAREIAFEIASHRGITLGYVDAPESHDWGGTQRNLGYHRLANGDYILAIDDDDVFLPGAFQTIRRRIAEHPGRPLMFRMEHHIVGTIWKKPAVSHRNVGTGMLVLPNDEARMGRYSARYEGDLDFFRETEALWPGGFVWLEDVIIACRKTWLEVGGAA